MCAILNVLQSGSLTPREDSLLEGEASIAGGKRCSPLAEREGHFEEELLARLTTAAYQVALRHGIKGSFAKLQLDLWHELRTVCDDSTEGAGAWRR